MRKYIISTILIILGIYLAFIDFNNKNNPTYSETKFAEEAKKFDSNFEKFTSEVNSTLTSIKNNFDQTIKIGDSLRIRKFFLDQLQLNGSISSVGYFQGTYKVVARNEDPTYVFAIDSTTEMNVVKWQRFQNEKIISNWYESFDQSVYNTSWFKNLIAENDGVKWKHSKSITVASPDNQEEFFYAGYSYLLNDTESAIILEFSKEQLFRSFKIIPTELNPRLSFTNSNGEQIILNTENVDYQDDSLQQSSTVDSLQISLTKHFSNFKNFKDVPSGTFTFKFKDQIYWNSFKRFNEETGIQYYLYTIPNSQLIGKSAGLLGEYKIWIGFFFVLLGIILMLVKRRFFYRPNNIKIPTVKELLEKEENRYLEFKSSLRWDYRQEKVNPELEKVIMKTIAAFGNTDGGILLIGVDDDKKILGLENDFQTLKKTDADYYEVHLRNIMHKLMGVKYVSKYIRTEFEQLEDHKLVCKIKVISAHEPVYLKYNNKNGQAEEKFYVRSGNSSHEIKSIAEINDYINTKFK